MIRDFTISQGCEIEFSIRTLDGKLFTVRGLAEHPIRLTNAVVTYRMVVDVPSPPRKRPRKKRQTKRRAKR